MVLSIVFIGGCSTNIYEEFGTLEFSMKDGFYHTKNSGYLYFFDYESCMQ